ncbi:MAG: exonuclease SbcCD subunit D [Lachnospiraceae bacterium]|nr:exonuclease SbcCD subunit D [Lachnospiraceae bacterium]
MRFMHLADLHIGKKMNGFSMLVDQKYILEQVLEVAKQKDLDGVLLAGDIYDKSVPAGEAIQLLDWFLTELIHLKLEVYMISGNHDSMERLSFGSKLFARSGLHVSTIYDGSLEPIVLQDEYGPLNLYMLPFVKPVHVRNALKKALEMTDEEEQMIFDIATYDDAVAAVLERAMLNSSERNVLVAHQLVTGAQRCDSEDISVGGIDNVSADLFEDFDYVALGHIHGPQSMTRDTIRYSGTLLKYSFSECSHEKSITIVDVKEKGNVFVEEIFVKPLRDVRIIEGDFKTIMSRKYYEGMNCEDYLKIILKDEQDVPEAMGKLRSVYPNVMALEYNNRRTKQQTVVGNAAPTTDKLPIEYFREFYERQNGDCMSEVQEMVVRGAFDRIWG